MQRLLVSYDLVSEDGKERTEDEYRTLASLLAVYRSQHVQESLWFVELEATASDLRAQLASGLTTPDRLLIAHVPHSSAEIVLNPIEVEPSAPGSAR